MILLAANPTPIEATSAKKYRVSGRVVSVSRICGGGAAITDEMVAALPPPQPLPGRTLLVVAGEQITSGAEAGRVRADANGRFEIRLAQGTWCFFDAARKLDNVDKVEGQEPLPAPTSSNIDAACLAQERRRCDQIVQVDRRSQSDVEVAFYESCSQTWNQPCYRGPMPP